MVTYTAYDQQTKMATVAAFPSLALALAQAARDAKGMPHRLPVRQRVEMLLQPSAYAMLLAGLGLMGAIVRRRESKRDSKGSI